MDMLPVHSVRAQWLGRESGFFMPVQAASFATVLYAQAGSAHCICQGKPFLLCRGSFLLLPPGWGCTLLADAGEAPSLLQLELEGFGDSFAPMLWQHPLLEQIARECTQEDAFSQGLTLALSNQLVLLMLRQRLLQAQGALSGDQAILSRALRHIQENAATRLSVPDLAQKTGVSASYLTALFHKHLPFSPGEFIRRAKLQKSKEMIREGQLNLTQIAAALEYSTVHQFSRQFKEIFGISPSEYAKQTKALP